MALFLQNLQNVDIVYILLINDFCFNLFFLAQHCLFFQSLTKVKTPWTFNYGMAKAPQKTNNSEIKNTPS